jgi:hypothetical protein
VLVLCVVVELPIVLIDDVVPLLQVEELCQLAAHVTCRNAMTTEGGVELTPQDLMIIL